MIKDFGKSPFNPLLGPLVYWSKNFLFDLRTKEIVNQNTCQRMPYGVDGAILVYEERQKTWFFDVADELRHNDDAEFVILMIAIAYLEASQQFLDGKVSKIGESTKTTKKALKRIFHQDLEDSEVKEIVEGARNGLFHSGITKQGVLTSRKGERAFTRLGKNMVINPYLFLDAVKKDHNDYIANLKNKTNEDLRKKFWKFWTECGAFA
jgi:hypothetical protein